MKQRKGPEQDAAQKLREDHNRITKRPVPPEARKNLDDLFKKEDSEKKPTAPKKIAKSDHEAGL